jgi:hypothetical protein
MVTTQTFLRVVWLVVRRGLMLASLSIGGALGAAPASFK